MTRTCDCAAGDLRAEEHGRRCPVRDLLMVSPPTPGPWTIRPSGEVGTDDYLIAVVYPTAIEHADAHEANARLIAHAPAMREALERMLSILNPNAKWTRLQTAQSTEEWKMTTWTILRAIEGA